MPMAVHSAPDGGGAPEDTVATGHDVLFEPMRLGALRLKNRIVMAPMGTALEDGGHVTDAAVAYYVRRARGGVGTITVEGCLVSAYSEGPEPRIHSREYLPGLRKLVEALRHYDVTVGVQLMHPGRQVVRGRRVAPSPIPLGPGTPVPDVLSAEEIGEVVRDYQRATTLAREAGFDFVEVHGAHGYLPSSFLSPLVNQRDDEYGGSLGNRARFCREVARGIVAVAGEKMPLVWRLNGDDGAPGGIGIDDATQVARWLEEDGVAAISVSSGTWHTLHVTLAPMFVPRGHMVPLAATIKRAVGIPVMAVGRLDDPDLAARVIGDGAADLICLGRGLIADPDWPLKVQTRAPERVRPCIACNVCVDLVGQGSPARCAVNPEVGQDLTWEVRPAATRRRVMVIGSGPAGMEAARLAALRGHEVSVWERDDELGGKFEVASLAPSKHEVLRAREYQIKVLAELGVGVHLGHRVTAADVREQRPDVALIATGATPLMPPIPGIDGDTVHDAQEYLRGDREVRPGQHIVVVGGSATGCETAEQLVQRGARVTLIDMLPHVGHGIEAISRRQIVRGLKRSGVAILTSSRVTRIDRGAVCYECVDEGTPGFLAADGVALALGWTPTGSDLAGELALADEFDPVEVHVVGDAAAPGDFASAVISAARVALAI